jgi:hypothetical protein
VAGTTGLEPATSAVTGQRSNQLNYVPTRQINEMRNHQCSSQPPTNFTNEASRGFANRHVDGNEQRWKISQKYPNSFPFNTKVHLAERTPGKAAPVKASVS